MNRTMLVCLVALGLSGCGPLSPGGLEFSNIHSTRLHQDPGTGLMVISDQRKGTMWFRIVEDYEVESLSTVPQASFYRVEQLSVSPDDRLLAILSVGEGHPIVDVFDLEAVLACRNSDEDGAVEPLRYVDPYPGTIWIKGWKGDRLVLRCDVPLDRLDRLRRRVPVQDSESQPRTFYWHVATDTIEVAPYGAQN